jgi:hypothetical protein
MSIVFTSLNPRWAYPLSHKFFIFPIALAIIAGYGSKFRLPGYFSGDNTAQDFDWIKDIEQDYYWKNSLPSSDTPNDTSGLGEVDFLLNRFGYSIRSETSTIPNILHLVPPEDFGFIQYLSFASSIHSLKPTIVFAHFFKGTIPDSSINFWWNKTLENFSNLADFRILEVEQPHVIWEGVKVQDRSHMADIIRLQVLIEHGGIYIDSDLIVLRSFESLMIEDVVMGIEAHWINDDKTVQIEGLCNALIMAKKGSPFLKRWWNEYRSFDDSKWCVMIFTARSIKYIISLRYHLGIIIRFSFLGNLLKLPWIR